MKLFCLVLALLASCASVFAQPYPNKPLRVIAAYAAGGAVDLMARYLCAQFQQSMEQPCVVENKTGAGGMIGLDQVAKAAPDGYTLTVAPNNLVIIPALYPRVPYDTLADFAPVALISRTPMMIGVHASAPARSLQDLVTQVRKSDGSAIYTTCGPGSPQHIAGEMMAAQGGFKWTHIPYKGCGAAFADVLAARVPVFISTVAHFNPQIKNGKLRGLAVLGAERTAFAPEFPTAAESGFPGFHVDVWFGLLAPARTPPEIVAKLNAEVNKAIAQPDLKQKLEEAFYEPMGGTPERFAAVIRNDLARMGVIVRKMGISPE